MAIQPNSSYNQRKHIIQQTAFGCFRLLSYGGAVLHSGIYHREGNQSHQLGVPFPGTF